MAYNPRQLTGIPTEPVGSLPRPQKLQEGYIDYDHGRITLAALEALQEDAARDSIQRCEATGAPIISDGEQRWSSFATYPVTDTLAGTGLANNLGGGGQYFAIFADGHNRQLPKLTGGPFRYKAYASDGLKKSIKLTSKPMKQAVIAPSMLALLYPLNEDVPGYSRTAFESDLVDECERDIRQAFAAGAERVSIDFTEGRLACRCDPRNPWTGAGLLPHFIALNNRDRSARNEAASPPSLWTRMISEKVPLGSSPTSVANMQNMVLLMNRAIRISSTPHFRRSSLIFPKSCAASRVMSSRVRWGFSASGCSNSALRTCSAVSDGASLAFPPLIVVTATCSSPVMSALRKR